MADPVVIPDDSPLGEGGEDVEMEGTGETTGGAGEGEENALPEDAVQQPAQPIAFLDYLKSPIVQLNIGEGVEATTLSAHQDLLTKSPYFEQACASFPDPASLSNAPPMVPAKQKREIDLPEADLNAMGGVLEYLYNGEYFPRRVGDTLETHPSIPGVDESGDQLLRHAHIYNLAESFHLPSLKSLAHSKIHRTTSTARGEIAFARHVYKTTDPTDTAIRAPIAAFWGTRSHKLRHEAEEEFRAMCLEFPQFGFDVLSRVLDQKEKGKGGGSGPAVGGAAGGASDGVGVTVGATPKTGRKRARVSTGG
ncbi:MAG: hypothetical protein M1831_007122 [Alyxoria varia]|nr:MAG: hypothetical protein M1831_007122 [Alyxoria varia]